MKIAIDGPGGAGKSTAAKLLAKGLGMTYIDTGAMYRAVALAADMKGIAASDDGAVIGLLNDIDIGVSHDPVTGEQLISLDGRDVGGLIRTPRISAGASDVSRIPGVRIKLVELQRRIAAGRDVIMDGRDIGTYVFPDAEKKYFLTAAPETRAMRRFLELRGKGVDTTFEQCLSELRARDLNDSTRAFAPLAVAQGALVVETDDMEAAEVAEYLRSDVVAYLRSGISGIRGGAGDARI